MLLIIALAPYLVGGTWQNGADGISSTATSDFLLEGPQAAKPSLESQDQLKDEMSPFYKERHLAMTTSTRTPFLAAKARHLTEQSEDVLDSHIVRYLAVTVFFGLQSMFVSCWISILIAGISSVGIFGLVVCCQMRPEQQEDKFALQSPPHANPSVSWVARTMVGKSIQGVCTELNVIAECSDTNHPLLAGYSL
jgi:hypothetical protein